MSRGTEPELAAQIEAACGGGMRTGGD
jgi:hypothetical protein